MFNNEEIILRLTNDQALVLFEFLTKLNESSDDAVFDNEAEQKVVWDIQTQLEKLLTEPLMGNYEDLLKVARNNIIANQ